MIGLTSLRRSSMASVQEPDLKTETTRCFSPDILHVFNDERDTRTRPSSSQTLMPHHDEPSTFPQFSRLPIELRLLIWEAALPEPTIVPRTWNSPCGYNLHRKVPEVLQACCESRRFLISSRRNVPGAPNAPKYQLIQRHNQQDAGVYMNWRTDSIWINRGYDITDAEVAAYTNLQSLIMTWGLRPCWVESALDEGINFIRRFPQLKLLTLLVDFAEHGWPEPSTLKYVKKLKHNEVKRIWGLVQMAFRETSGHDPTWSPPSLRIVHRTTNWSRKGV